MDNNNHHASFTIKKSPNSEAEESDARVTKICEGKHVWVATTKFSLTHCCTFAGRDKRPYLQRVLQPEN